MKTNKNSDLKESTYFIWGVKSSDDDSGSEIATKETLNDMAIIYNKESNTYELSVEQVYKFDTLDNEINYYIRLLECFTKYIESIGFKTDNIPKFDYDIGQNGIDFDCTSVTISGLYGLFEAKVAAWTNDLLTKESIYIGEFIY